MAALVIGVLANIMWCCIGYAAAGWPGAFAGYWFHSLNYAILEVAKILREQGQRPLGVAPGKEP